MSKKTVYNKIFNEETQEEKIKQYRDLDKFLIRYDL